MTLHNELNKQIANWSTLYIKLHNYHWYVKGSQFFTLHEKFQELYEEAALHVDEIAERLLAVKGKPIATMSDYLKTSSIKEANNNEMLPGFMRNLGACYYGVFENSF